MAEWIVGWIILIIPIAFVCEFLDSSLGMGYGTVLTPVLLIMGFNPLQIVPAVLLSEFVSGLTAAAFHHTSRNVYLHPKSIDFKVAIFLALLSVIGTVASVFVMVNLSPRVLKLWIGAIVFAMGVIILLTYKLQPKFSWPKIGILGAVAGFNKGLSGGGYGPLVMGGQILSGIGVKNAVGITSLAEGLTCLTGVILYFCLRQKVDWVLAPWTMAGAVLSIPFAVYIVKKVPEKQLKLIAAGVIIILGCLTFGKEIMKMLI